MTQINYASNGNIGMWHSWISWDFKCCFSIEACFLKWNQVKHVVRKNTAYNYALKCYTFYVIALKFISSKNLLLNTLRERLIWWTQNKE